MKIFLSFLLIIVSTNLYTQTRADVKTPNYNDVVAYNLPEWSDSERDSFDVAQQALFPHAQMQATYPTTNNPNTSSTGRFNCHGYAWYMCQPGGSGLIDPRWIGRYEDNVDEHIYWEDGSYIEIPNEAYGCIISYDPEVSDHSAIYSGIPGKFLSKWGAGPLMLHDWDDCPYMSGSPDLIYYKLNCSRVIQDQTINSDHDFNGCDIQLTNVIIGNNIDVNISFDDWTQIDGEFLVPVGAVLNVTP